MPMPKVGNTWSIVRSQTFLLANARSNGANAISIALFGALVACFSGRVCMTKFRVSAATSALVLLSTINPAVAEGDVALGQKAFQRCSACHSTTDQKKAGPGLGGVVGRVAGSVEGVRYSAAMKSSGLVWDEATLDRFLAAPREVVPKTTMSIVVPKPEDRQNIIAYLKSLSQ